MDHTVVRLATCSNPNTAGAENDTAEERLSDQDILVRLKDLVGDFDAFAEFLATDDEREFALGDVPDKLTRSTIHHLLKQYGRVGLFSQTFCDGDRKLIKVSKGRPPSGNQFQNSIHKFAGGDCHYLQVIAAAITLQFLTRIRWQCIRRMLRH